MTKKSVAIGAIAALGLALAGVVIYGLACGGPRVDGALACPEPEIAIGSFRHRRSSVLATGSRSLSRAVDAVAIAGTAFEVTGKFAYGRLSRDLEDETVVAFLRTEPCGAWTEIGRAETDDDGYVRVAGTAGPPGIGEVRLYLANGTYVESKLYAFEPETPVAIFDVDGTLTIDDGEVFEQAAGVADAEAYDGAAEVVRYWFEGGTPVLYLTGRSDDFLDMTREWLERRGFPRGPLVTTTSLRDASGTGVEAHKLRFLEWVVTTARLRVRAAYGNATTDVCAYSRAGLDLARTFIVGPHAGTACDGFPPTRALTHYRRHHERLVARAAPDDAIADE
jgi:hypothetical protein